MMVKEEGEKNIEYKNMGGREGREERRIWKEGKGEKREKYGRKRGRRDKNMGGREGGEERRIWEEGKGEKRQEYGRKGKGKREKIMRGWKGRRIW